MIIAFHLVIFYVIGMFLAYGYIDLNNKFEDRRKHSNEVIVGGSYKTYYIKKKNMFKSFYFFVELYLLKKY